jgi:hypothetical protein
MNPKWIRIKRILALAGGIMGISAGILVGAFRFGWLSWQQRIPEVPSSSPSPPTGVGVIDGLAFMLVFILPFVLCLYALRLKTPTLQAAIWLGISVLAFLGSAATFSAVTLVTMPITAVLLGIAGLIAFREAGVRQALFILAVGGALFVIGSASFYALFSQEDPVCWALIQTESEEQVWEPRPYSETSPNLPANPEPGELAAWSCTSDTVSISESLMSMSLWALALLAMMGIQLSKRQQAALN